MCATGIRSRAAGDCPPEIHKETAQFFGLHAFTRRKAETGRKMSQSPAARERLRPRFAAEATRHLDRATTAASRVNRAGVRFEDASQGPMSEWLSPFAPRKTALVSVPISSRTSARLGTVVCTGCLVTPSRSKPWHTGKVASFNRPSGRIRAPWIIAGTISTPW